MIRIGIIGAGPNAAGHAKYYANSTRSQVVAIADPDQQRATALANEVQAEALADYREFLDRVDAVVVSSPNFLHREHAIACAEAGKHVYCEKPMGLSLTDAQAIAQAVNQAGVKSAVGFSVRFDPTIQTAQRLIQEGTLGTLVSLCSRRMGYFPPESMQGWRGDARLSGGLLLEISLHELDWMLALGGKVRSVYARTWARKAEPRANDHLWITLNYTDGAVGSHEGSWMSPTPVYYRGVIGTERGLHTDEWSTKLYSAFAGENRTELPLDPPFDLRGHFLDCIEQNATPVADINWGLYVMTIAEAIFESAASGQVVQVETAAVL